MLKQISKNEFEAFVMFSRDSRYSFFIEEVEYYANTEKTLFGTIAKDKQDNDFSCVILKRDKSKRFVAIDNKINFKTIGEARIWIENRIDNYKTAKDIDIEQSTHREKQKGINLFDIIIDKNNVNPYFKRLNEDIEFLPAKQMIVEVSHHFSDIDGNFVREFQSINGFDSRLWEIYLFCFLQEEKFLIDRNETRPDFSVQKYGQDMAIEAVIVNRKNDNPPKYDEKLKLLAEEEIIKETSNEMPLRFASALTSKLEKKYWELSHVKNKPIILAIADFHDNMSMTWSSTSLINYIYGIKSDFYYDEKGQLIIKPKEISHYNKPSGALVKANFFSLPDSENISAILFSSTATISKFTRMGIQAGFTQGNIACYRMVKYHDHDPNACKPKEIKLEVNEHSNETWAEGMNLFHNPNAKYKIDKSLFPNIAHHELIDNQIVSTIPKFHPYNSVTHILHGIKSSSK